MAVCPVLGEMLVASKIMPAAINTPTIPVPLSPNPLIPCILHHLWLLRRRKLRTSQGVSSTRQASTPFGW